MPRVFSDVSHPSEVCVAEALVAADASMLFRLHRPRVLQIRRRPGSTSYERDTQTMITVDTSPVHFGSQLPFDYREPQLVDLDSVGDGNHDVEERRRSGSKSRELYDRTGADGSREARVERQSGDKKGTFDNGSSGSTPLASTPVTQSAQAEISSPAMEMMLRNIVSDQDVAGPTAAPPPPTKRANAHRRRGRSRSDSSSSTSTSSSSASY